MPTLIDTHCHLDYDFTPKQEADLIREGKEAGITKFVTIGVDLSSIERLGPISERNAEVWHTVGVHPHEAVSVQEGALEKIRLASRHPKCVGIGEIGLDYHYDHSPRDVQKRIFEQQLEIALEEKKPIVIHSRDGESDLLERLKAYAPRVQAGQVPGIIHCFTGTRDFGLACIELGFMISFSGIITFKKAEDLRECAREFPLNRILVETDSPYLAPVPHRGKKCEPSMVKLTAMKIAEIKGLSLDEVALATTQNAEKVFKLI